MQEISKHVKEIDSRRIETYTCVFEDACIMEAEAGSTGYEGGDGSRTYIRLSNLGGSGIEISVNELRDSVEIMLGGDAELSNFIGFLRFVNRVLRDAIMHKRAIVRAYENE